MGEGENWEEIMFYPSYNHPKGAIKNRGAISSLAKSIGISEDLAFSLMRDSGTLRQDLDSNNKIVWHGGYTKIKIPTMTQEELEFWGLSYGGSTNKLFLKFLIEAGQLEITNAHATPKQKPVKYPRIKLE